MLNLLPQLRAMFLGPHITLPRLVSVLIAGGLLLQTTAQAQQSPGPSISESLTITVGPKFAPDPTEVRGVSGGSMPVPDVAERTDTTNGPCVGFVGDKPNHTLVLTDFFEYLSLQIQSPEDTTLVVSGPGGTWCNDDYKGKNPGIAGEWLAGTYEIWIGSYGKEKYHPYILRLTEKR